MPIKVTCTNCGGVLHAPDDAGGKRGRCPTCGNVLPIPLDAPKASMATSQPSLPDAPKPTGGRPPSFGDFALGAPAPSRASAPAMAAGKASVDTASRPDPFARPATPGAAPRPQGEITPGVVKGWKRASRGMFMTQLGIILLMLPFLGMAGLKIAAVLAKKDQIIPYKVDGYLGLKWLSSIQEVELIVVGIPLFFGLFMLVLGRLAVSGAPRRSHAKGIGKLAALATLMALMGLVAVVFPIAAMIITNGDANNPPPVIERLPNKPPGWQMFDLQSDKDTEGMIQLFGLMLGFAGLVVAEIWFLSAFGRIGTALDSGAVTRRATRVSLVLGGLLGICILLGALKPDLFFADSMKDESARMSKFAMKEWTKYVQPELDKMGENKGLVFPGVIGLVTLFVGLGYLRMLSGGRSAVRQWLEQNGQT